jgi:glycerol-3-phosphate acyltransferase PlsY
MIELLLAGLWGYLLGAVPTGVMVSKAMRGVDVRQQGSGHTGGLNVSRVAGFWGGALTAVVDALLGAAAVAGATLAAENPWAGCCASTPYPQWERWPAWRSFG